MHLTCSSKLAVTFLMMEMRNVTMETKMIQMDAQDFAKLSMAGIALLLTFHQVLICAFAKRSCVEMALWTEEKNATMETRKTMTTAQMNAK